MGTMLSYSLQTAPAPKGGALGKWLLVSWLLLRMLISESCLLDLHCPWVSSRFINYDNINSQQMPTHIYVIFMKYCSNSLHFQLQAFPFPICWWSKYSFMCFFNNPRTPTKDLCHTWKQERRSLEK